MVNSKRKGKEGELELARKLRDAGFDVHRGQQYCGINGDADLVGIPGVHIECKRTNYISLYDFIDQAKRDAKEGELPMVFIRKDHCEWVVAMPFDAAIRLIRDLEV